MHSGIAFVKLRVAEIQHLGTITVELHTDCESHTSYPDKILESQSNGSTNPWLTELMLYPSQMVQFGGPYPPQPETGRKCGHYMPEDVEKFCNHTGH